MVPAFPTGHIALPALGRSQLGLKHAYRTLTGSEPKTFRPPVQSANHYAPGTGFSKFLYLFVFFRQFCILTVHSADFRLSPVFTAEAINYYSFPSSLCQSLPPPLAQSPPPPPKHSHTATPFQQLSSTFIPTDTCSGFQVAGVTPQGSIIYEANELAFLKQCVRFTHPTDTHQTAYKYKLALSALFFFFFFFS